VSSSRVWLIPPIDGVKSIVAGIPAWASAALSCNGPDTNGSPPRGHSGRACREVGVEPHGRDRPERLAAGLAAARERRFGDQRQGLRLEHGELVSRGRSGQHVPAVGERVGLDNDVRRQHAHERVESPALVGPCVGPRHAAAARARVDLPAGGR
jgi:hypothetical protein